MSSDRYPAWLPVGVAEVLGMPNFHLHPISLALREVGIDVPHRFEGEMAAALAFLLPIAIEHGVDWRAHASGELQRLKNGGLFVPPVLAVLTAANSEEGTAA
jgi:hypothetical protein